MDPLISVMHKETLDFSDARSLIAAVSQSLAIPGLGRHDVQYLSFRSTIYSCGTVHLQTDRRFSSIYKLIYSKINIFIHRILKTLSF